MPVGSLHNREVKLIRHVRGEINPEDFAIMETAIPVPGPQSLVPRLHLDAVDGAGGCKGR